MANHDELVAFLVQLGDFHVHLGDQRAGRVKDLEPARTGFPLNGLAHAVGAEHQRRARRHVGQLLDEDRAFLLQVIDHIGVVNDLMAHVNRRAKLGQRPLDDFNGAVHPGAKAAWLGQKDFFRHWR